MFERKRRHRRIPAGMSVSVFNISPTLMRLNLRILSSRKRVLHPRLTKWSLASAGDFVRNEAERAQSSAALKIIIT